MVVGCTSGASILSDSTSKENQRLVTALAMIRRGELRHRNIGSLVLCYDKLNPGLGHESFRVGSGYVPTLSRGDGKTE